MGVLVKLKVSARNWKLYFSRILMSLNKDRLRLKNPGPLSTFLPLVPNTVPTGFGKLDVANHGIPNLIPFRICTGAIWAAGCVFPGAAKVPPFAGIVIGVPDSSISTPDIWQPPNIFAAGPEFSHRLPGPNGTW